MKQKIGLLFFSTTICLILVEIAFRINGKYISYNERTESGSYVSPFKTGDEGWTFTYKSFTKIENVKPEFRTSWTANNEGLHEKNISLSKSGKRIMVFGDSFTEGAGAPNDSCYPRILETLLKANFDSTIQVINCGVSSSDIFFEYQLMKLKMLKYEPDLVLLTFNSTDYYDFRIRGGFERFIPNNLLQYRQAPWFEPLYAHSYLARRIVHDLYHYDYDFLKHEQRVQMNDSAVKMIAIALDSFQTLCSAYNIKLGVIFHPMAPEIANPENYKMGNLMVHCKQKNVPYADQLHFLQQYVTDSTYRNSISWPVDGHFKSKGYELLAQCAFEFIDKQGWLTRLNLELPHKK